MARMFGEVAAIGRFIQGVGSASPSRLGTGVEGGEPTGPILELVRWLSTAMLRAARSPAVGEVRERHTAFG